MIRLCCGRMIGEKGRSKHRLHGRDGQEGLEHGDVLILDGTVRFQHTRANPCRY